MAQAIDRISMIYEKEHTHTIPAEAAAEAMNYTSLNGTSKSILSALRKYGLLNSGSDGYKVSDDAITILELPADDPQRVAAIHRAALRPSVFKLLHDKYGTSLPSDGTLRHFLVQNNYQSDGANQVIRFYKETLDFLTRIAPRLAEKDSRSKAITQITPEDHGTSADVQAIPSQHDLSPMAPTSSGRLRFHISQNCDAEVNFSGTVTQEAIDKLIQYLEISKDVYQSSKDTHKSRTTESKQEEEEEEDFDLLSN
jgi:hypothetical protein